MQTSSLKAIAAQREKHAIKKLKKIFPPGSPSLKKRNLTALMKEANRELSRREDMWAPFLRENLQPLEILQEVTQTIDKRAFNVVIERMNIRTNEHGVPISELSGVFRSPTGTHFTDFAKFVEYFQQQSQRMLLVDYDDDQLGAGEGVKFTFKLKLKEKKDDY